MLVDAVLKGLGAIELGCGGYGAGEGGLPLTDVPVLLIAGSEEEINRESAMNAGADGLLLPPIELESLVPELFQIVGDWRKRHPDRPWADQAAQSKD